MVEFRRLWQQLAAEAGEDIGLTQGGVAYLARGPRDMQAFAEWLPNAAAHGLDTRLLDADETAALIPWAPHWPPPGGLVTPSDLRAEPWLAVPALARLAAREGVIIAEGCAARRLDRAAGRVAGVLTEAGRVAAPAVVLAGGAWSSLFLRAHGVAIPQLSVRATVAATEALPQVWTGGAADDRIAFRRRADGGYTLAIGGAHDLWIGPDAFRALPRTFPSFAPTRSAPASASPPRRAGPTPGARRAPAAHEESPFERLRILDPAPETPATSSGRAPASPRCSRARPRPSPRRLGWA